MTTIQQPWPDGVIARYLTVGNATVDIHEDASEDEYIARCTGCTTSWSNSRTDWKLQHMVRPWAQEHAEKCRAMHRPGGGQR